MVKLGDFPVKDEIYPTTVQTSDDYRIVSRFSEISKFLYHLRFEFTLLLLTFLAIIFSMSKTQSWISWLCFV